MQDYKKSFHFVACISSWYNNPWTTCNLSMHFSWHFLLHNLLIFSSDLYICLDLFFGAVSLFSGVPILYITWSAAYTWIHFCVPSLLDLFSLGFFHVWALYLCQISFYQRFCFYSLILWSASSYSHIFCTSHFFHACLYLTCLIYTPSSYQFWMFWLSVYHINPNVLTWCSYQDQVSLNNTKLIILVTSPRQRFQVISY